MSSNKEVFVGLFLLIQCNFSWSSPLQPPNELDSTILSLNRRDLSSSGVKEKETTQWCDPVLGCLYMWDDSILVKNRVNQMPASRNSINTQFYLSTRPESNLEQNYVVSADNLTSLAKSTFLTSRRTLFVVHGFIDSANTKWVKDMTSSLLDYGDYNVLRVNWVHGSRGVLYSHATANSRVVGLEIGHFVNTLITTWNLDPAEVHCIGHSLGAHVCGYAGEKINKMGRITGLDPAGPAFTGTPDFVHLDPSDATFVDNIHTDSDSILVLGYGTAQPMGNLDFFPNSGHDQPGCGPVDILGDLLTPDDDFIDATKDVVACSHLRSIDLFIETLHSPSCQWLGQSCEDYDTFEKGGCFSCGLNGSNCAYMGMKANQYTEKSREFVTLFLDTDKKSPYCLQEYEVSILTELTDDAEKWVMGKIFISLYGANSEVIEKFQITSNHEKIVLGDTVTGLLKSHTAIAQILRIELKWVYNEDPFNPASYCMAPFCNRSLYVRSVQVTPMNLYPQRSRITYSSLGCNCDGSVIKIKDRASSSFTSNLGVCQPIY